MTDGNDDGAMNDADFALVLVFTEHLKRAVQVVDSAGGLQCAPGCICSMHRAVTAARVWLDDFERARRGDFVPGGLPTFTRPRSN